MKLTLVFHSTKVGGVGTLDRRLGANPPMTMEGMANIHDLVPKIKKGGPYDALYSSLIARALDGASVLALELGMEIQTITRLGQFGNKDNDGTVIMYPGHEGDGFVSWQLDGLAAINTMHESHPEGNVIGVSHRPIIGGLVALAQGISDSRGIEAIVGSPETTKNGFVVFDFDGKSLQVVG